MKEINTIPVSSLFDIDYGTKLDFKKMQITSASNTEGVCFVSRSSKNLGVVAIVKKYKDIKSLPAGVITVALGGSYLLSAFVQEQPFYTAQNVAVLTPKSIMTYEEKLFYCLCLGKNRFKYSAFGREANRTLKTIQIPKVTPDWLQDVNRLTNVDISKPILNIKLNLQDREWEYFKLSNLFNITGSKTTSLSKLKRYGEGKYPYITTQATNNGVAGYYDFC